MTQQDIGICYANTSDFTEEDKYTNMSIEMPWHLLLNDNKRKNHDWFYNYMYVYDNVK